MPKITIASLERRILVLESEKQTLGGQLSINGEFQLEAFKLLLGAHESGRKALRARLLHTCCWRVSTYHMPEMQVKCMGAPEPVVIDGVLWKPYSVNHIDADGRSSLLHFCD